MNQNNFNKGTMKFISHKISFQRIKIDILRSFTSNVQYALSSNITFNFAIFLIQNSKLKDMGQSG
ncbi:hypothetical protein BpHYR1_007857 [Brachionus plicatilis]|uniref:Uncharacterized protein n=1 Tax=Brachionus plicatilis TaxID=10195 RepID=A0A3M7SWZ3_BRAPC|nr:hypothetical protein BpHYR1_007857 [Brachionus plicatilis]